MTNSSNRGGFALLWLFTASGFAGLIYESIWTQYLGLILGHSAYAQVLVLSMFMGGMALGAWLISRRTEAFQRPLMIYAGAELLLGIFGVGFHGYFQAISGFSYDSLFPLLASGLPLELARWSIAALLILPQCILLGTTFPLMSAGYIRWQPQSSGRVLAGLYFSNSLGAAAGALCSTFVLLPAVGLPGTVLTAGIINVFVAMLVWPLAKRDQPTPPPCTPKVSTDGASRSAPGFILLVAGITGASSFVYEVSWVRMLAMALGSTIHAFELMLAAFIAGIAFGGLWLRKKADGLRSPRVAAGWAQIAMGTMALSTLFLYNQSFSWVAWAIGTLNRTSESAYTLYNIASAIIAMVIMFPTAFFAGMTLPLLTLTLLRENAGEGAIGKVYSANTLGSISGVLLAVLLLLPALGLRLSLWSAAAADMVLGILLLSRFTPTSHGLASTSNLRSVGVAAGATAILLLSFAFTHFDPILMSSGVFRSGAIPDKQSNLSVYFHQDGRTASVTLREIKEHQRTILTNGKPDASINFGPTPSNDEITMMAAGILPMIHNPDGKTVAIIGFGSGMTTHFVLGNPKIERVDTIEIEPAMVEAARSFRPAVERAYTDPRSHIVIDDAKSYFATNRKKYDIIISEPSNPWVNGVASLFTEEFYSFIPLHLNEDGVFAQWVQAYELTPALMNTIIRAMQPHFVDIRLFSAGETDWLLIASPRKPFQSISSMSIPRDWDREVYREMAARGIADDQDLALLFHGDKHLLSIYSTLYPNSGTNSDYFPLLQLGSAKSRFNRAMATEPAALRVSLIPVFEALTGVPVPPIDYRPNAALIRSLPLANSINKAHAIYRAVVGQAPSGFSGDLTTDDNIVLGYVLAESSRCPMDEYVAGSTESLLWLLTATVPYLPAKQSQEMWHRTGWSRCHAPKDTFLKEFIRFADASVARNHEAVLRIGTSLLNRSHYSNGERINPEAHNYIVDSMQLSAYIMTDYTKVKELFVEHGRHRPMNIARSILALAAAFDEKTVRGSASAATGKK